MQNQFNDSSFLYWCLLSCSVMWCFCIFPDIEFKQGEKQHVVEVEVLFDGVREMREAFMLHLKPDENMVAEIQVRSVFFFYLNTIITFFIWALWTVMEPCVCKCWEKPHLYLSQSKWCDAPLVQRWAKKTTAVQKIIWLLTNSLKSTLSVC